MFYEEKIDDVFLEIDDDGRFDFLIACLPEPTIFCLTNKLNGQKQKRKKRKRKKEGLSLQKNEEKKEENFLTTTNKQNNTKNKS